MSRLFSSAFLFLASLAAHTQDAKPEPVEHASPLVVILFLVLFVGGIVAYAGYLWLTRKNDALQTDD